MLENEISSREQKLLVLAARLNPGPGEAKEMEDLLAGVSDWKNILNHFARLGIRPLLYRHLSRDVHALHVPGEVMDLLRKEYELQTLKNLRIYGCLRRLLGCLHGEGLPVIVLKGAFTAKYVYPEIGLRPMSDIDILCRPEDRPAVEKSLAGIGLGRQTGQEAYHSPLHQEILGGHARHLPPIYDRRIVKIELHSWLFFSDQANNAATIGLMWDRRLPHEWDGLPFGALSPEDHVLFQCVHLFHHAEKGAGVLYWFCDIHETIGHYGGLIDWESIFRFAEKIGVRTQLDPVLALMKESWNTAVPEEILRASRTPKIPLPEILGFARGSFPQTKLRALPFYYEKVKMAGEVNGWKKRIYFVWKLVFPSRANIRYRYRPANSFMLCLWCGLHPMIRIKRAVESLFFHAVYRVKAATEEPEIRGQRSEVGDQRSEIANREPTMLNPEP